MTAKTFIAISSETENRQLVYLTTNGYGDLYQPDGITYGAALDFLFGLVHKRKRRSGVVFVCYAFSRDNEFIFSTLPSFLKDKLFQSHRVKKRIDEIENNNEALDEILYSADKMTDDYQCADFEKYINGLALKELCEVTVNGYHVKLINGKSLTIRKYGKAITIYDIHGFFKPKSLRETVRAWTGKDVPLLDRRGVVDPTTELLKARAAIESYYVSELATRLDQALQDEGMKLTRYHGASALASHWLNKIGAKDSFCAYRHRRQLAPELYRASWQAYYGGRAEQFALGTVKHVKVYDINSAYAHACSFLPVLLQKPTFVSEWQDNPFSVWHCDYDFSRVNPFIGYLPHRDASNFTRYKLKGRGYFWQPEVAFVRQHFPQCIEIKQGFIIDYERAPFAQEIEFLYQCRQRLQDRKHPLEKVFKLALAALYGKFAQHNGHSRFFNLQYAGFITSFTRAQLLQAVKGYEHDTICFQTDAIHTSADLPVNLSGNLGDYKRTNYEKITYIDNGVYTGIGANDRRVKTKTRGATAFDFGKAITDINNRRVYSALNELFIGHNVYTQHLFTSAGYLAHHKVDKETSPLAVHRFAARIFDLAGVDGFDITQNFYKSEIVLGTSRESSLFTRSNYLESNFAIDTLEARRM